MKTTVVVSDSDSDNDNSSRRPSGGGPSKRRKGEDGSLPRWQTDKKFARSVLELRCHNTLTFAQPFIAGYIRR